MTSSTSTTVYSLLDPEHLSTGEELRTCTSLGSIAAKLVDFTYAVRSTASTGEFVRQRFCRVRRDMLFAIVARCPEKLDASVVELGVDGELYLADDGWTSELSVKDWPGPTRLSRAEHGFAAPAPRAGLTAYCVWSNVSAEGRKGIAVMRDIAEPSGDIEYLVQAEELRDAEDTGWHSPETVPNMYRPGRVRTRGSAIAVPILVQATRPTGLRDQGNVEPFCVGALHITHPAKAYFDDPRTYVWAYTCASLLGWLYRVCSVRLTELGEFSDWGALNYAIANGAQPRLARSSTREPALDVLRLREDLEAYRGVRKWEDVAGTLQLSSRTLRKLWNPGQCTLETAKRIVGVLGKRLEDYTIRT
ncbi:MAG TPA: hypothetical protein VJR89_02725 [Polyangiales bacterium]|nr:hypothetical protein [Polyangiales bacterium]